MKKVTTVLMFGVMSLILGFISGLIIWVILKLINVGTELIWAHGTSSLIYNLVICAIGAVFIGLLQRKHGILPDDTETVIEVLKKNGSYPYDKLAIIGIAVILPLIFGGALGPEAGLCGVIAGLCCWVGDSLKSRAYKLYDLIKSKSGDEDETIETLAETGLSVVLGIVFGAPLFGIADNLEPDSNKEKYGKKFLKKKGRIFIYCMGIIGGILAVKAFGALFSAVANASGVEMLINLASSGGLPKFPAKSEFSLEQLKWVIPLLASGIVLALIYSSFSLVTLKLSDKVKDKRVLSCLIAGVAVAVIGKFLPDTMFSGEHQMFNLISNFRDMSAVNLILTAVCKLLLVTICINFGWRGGNIFPIMFSAAAFAYALSLIFGIDGAFAAALVISSMHAYISRKFVTTAAILLLCFPITYIIPILLSAFIASKIPTPFNAE